ncbi:Neurobeachin-like protein 2 [Zancudomyces culisetae]|uniref:Beige protein homolog 1 n=1 Tax=Zancudomyces culisetae TaxID=1213189 RepID=A0A1R1PUI8_ZANCU|nr:Neurobeachin-like protein 2 [Zancudomyces culisetae]|eukprot:OMH84569.1 Neurobeachin-like protein 2 [Zancudomyces culisetae]
MTWRNSVVTLFERLLSLNNVFYCYDYTKSYINERDVAIWAIDDTHTSKNKRRNLLVPLTTIIYNNAGCDTTYCSCCKPNGTPRGSISTRLKSDVSLTSLRNRFSSETHVQPQKPQKPQKSQTKAISPSNASDTNPDTDLLEAGRVFDNSKDMFGCLSASQSKLVRVNEYIPSMTLPSQIIMRLRCTRILLLYEIHGYLEITKTEFKWVPERDNDGNLAIEYEGPVAKPQGKTESRDNSAHTRSQSGKDVIPPVIYDKLKCEFSIPLVYISDVIPRSVVFKKTAIEVFFSNSDSILLNIVNNSKDRMHLYSKLQTLVYNTRLLSFLDANNPKILIKKTDIVKRWQYNELSNFDYLMALNTLAGRSYNDLSQYPVFPWILSDYTSESIDLDNPESYRDLSKPVGALNEDRLRRTLERYASFEDPTGNIPKFHYGTHYSNPATVAYYLIRLEPFTSLHLMLQNGKFDHPDRQFHSIAESFHNCLHGSGDVKELIPEFFYSPDFLTNVNHLELGTRQNSTRLGDVVLPPYAHNSPAKFIEINRKALESEYVSRNLHLWIDLIFGYKQTGPEAVEAHNVFYYLTYESAAVGLDKLKDPHERKSKQSQISNFGMTPIQLFERPHVQKKVIPKQSQKANNEKSIDKMVLTKLATQSYPLEAACFYDLVNWWRIASTDSKDDVSLGFTAHVQLPRVVLAIDDEYAQSGKGMVKMYQLHSSSTDSTTLQKIANLNDTHFDESRGNAGGFAKGAAKADQSIILDQWLINPMYSNASRPITNMQDLMEYDFYDNCTFDNEQKESLYCTHPKKLDIIISGESNNGHVLSVSRLVSSNVIQLFDNVGSNDNNRSNNSNKKIRIKAFECSSTSSFGGNTGNNSGDSEAHSDADFSCDCVSAEDINKLAKLIVQCNASIHYSSYKKTMYDTLEVKKQQQLQQIGAPINRGYKQDGYYVNNVENNSNATLSHNPLTLMSRNNSYNTNHMSSSSLTQSVCGNDSKTNGNNNKTASPTIATSMVSPTALFSMPKASGINTIHKHCSNSFDKNVLNFSERGYACAKQKFKRFLGETLRYIRVKYEISTVVFSDCGKYVAVGCHNGTLMVFLLAKVDQQETDFNGDVIRDAGIRYDQGYEEYQSISNIGNANTMPLQKGNKALIPYPVVSGRIKPKNQFLNDTKCYNTFYFETGGADENFGEDNITNKNAINNIISGGAFSLREVGRDTKKPVKCSRHEYGTDILLNLYNEKHVMYKVDRVSEKFRPNYNTNQSEINMISGVDDAIDMNKLIPETLTTGSTMVSSTTREKERQKKMEILEAGLGIIKKSGDSEETYISSRQIVGYSPISEFIKLAEINVSYGRIENVIVSVDNDSMVILDEHKNIVVMRFTKLRAIKLVNLFKDLQDYYRIKKHDCIADDGKESMPQIKNIESAGIIPISMKRLTDTSFILLSLITTEDQQDDSGGSQPKTSNSYSYTLDLHSFDYNGNTIKRKALYSHFEGPDGVFKPVYINTVYPSKIRMEVDYRSSKILIVVVYNFGYRPFPILSEHFKAGEYKTDAMVNGPQQLTKTIIHEIGFDDL